MQDAYWITAPISSSLREIGWLFHHCWLHNKYTHKQSVAIFCFGSRYDFYSSMHFRSSKLQWSKCDNYITDWIGIPRLYLAGRPSQELALVFISKIVSIHCHWNVIQSAVPMFTTMTISSSILFLSGLIISSQNEEKTYSQTSDMSRALAGDKIAGAAPITCSFSTNIWVQCNAQRQLQDATRNI